MFKSDFLRKLRQVDGLQIPKKNYVITGSGPLAIRNVRRADDVDVVVTQNLWSVLSKKFIVKKNKIIQIGHVELWGDFPNVTNRMNEVLSSVQMIEGYPLLSLAVSLIHGDFMNKFEQKYGIKENKTV